MPLQMRMHRPMSSSVSLVPQSWPLWPAEPQWQAGAPHARCSVEEEKRRDLGLEYETTQGSRCEAKTHINSAYGLQRDS